ncbi:MAG: crAss001_48 related protein [Intestinibacter sp.]
MDFKERLLKELEDLSVKIDRLSRYITTTTEDAELEARQIDLMYKYKWVLELRIKKLMNKEEN